MKASKASQLTEELVNRCLDGLQATVCAKLETIEADLDDPFNQFMQAVDAEGQDKPKESDGDELA